MVGTGRVGAGSNTGAAATNREARDLDLVARGRASIAIASDIYSHMMPNVQEGAAAAVDGILRAAINKRADDIA
jgi:hypothetical protein